MSDSPLRQLPPVHQILNADAIRAVGNRLSHDAIVARVRHELDKLRQRILAGETVDSFITPDSIASQVIAFLESHQRPRFRRVINATGIILHTNLGRSVLSEPAARAAYDAATGYLNLELDLETGQRSSRQDFVRELLVELTGAESATVVNNCAAATVISLRAIAMGREVIVSRGQLIEIGGSFRIPEIMTVSGARLREVGTTNITRLRDYESAITPETAALMLVHPSNYRIRGFTESVELRELIELGRKHNIPVIDDCGSGAMLEIDAELFAGEPIIPERVRLGADLVLFSGDKLLGGPQSGIILGKKSLIESIERDPLMRAFRLDKMTLAALEATLCEYRTPQNAIESLPTLRMLTIPLCELRERAERLAERLRTIEELDTVLIIENTSYVGGGSVPDQELPAVVVGISARNVSVSELSRKLRSGNPSIMTRVHNDMVMVDLRTVIVREEVELLNVIEKVVRPSESG